MKLALAVIALGCLVMAAKAAPTLSWGPGPGAYRGSNYDYGYDNDNYDNDGYYYDDNYYNDRYYNRYRYPYRRSGLGLGAGLDLSLGRYY